MPKYEALIAQNISQYGTTEVFEADDKDAAVKHVEAIFDDEPMTNDYDTVVQRRIVSLDVVDDNDEVTEVVLEDYYLDPADRLDDRDRMHCRRVVAALQAVRACIPLRDVPSVLLAEIDAALEPFKEEPTDEDVR